MFRRTLLLIGACSLLFVMASCQPLSKHPLIDPNEADRDTRLYGAWVSVPQKDDDAENYGILQIGPATLPLEVGAAQPEKGLLQAWYLQHSHKTGEMNAPLGFFFVSSQVGPTWVASLSEGLDFSIGAAAKDDMSSTRRITDTEKRFWFLRYEVEDDTLKVWGVPKLAVIDAAIKAGELHGTVERDEKGEAKSIELTDSTEVLRKYFEANWQELFPGDAVSSYKRIAVPPAQ